MWVPHLADPDWVAATLRTHHRHLGLPAPPDRVELVDVRISNPHKPSSPRCHGWATYRAHHDHDHDDGGLLLLQAGAAGAPSAPHGGTSVPGMPLLVWRFPVDPRLPALRVLVDPASAAPRLPYRRAGLDVDQPYDLRVDVVRWQPGASATLRYRVGSGASTVGVYAKVLVDVPVGAVDDAQQRLYGFAPDALRVAEPLGADETLDVVWTREVQGRPLLDRLRAGSPAQLDRAAVSVAEALAALHGSDVHPVGTTSLRGHAAEADKKAAKLALAQPDLAAAAAAVARTAGAAARDAGHGQRPLHGDFHVEQFLDPTAGPVLLDLDAMVMGDPEVDLAEFAVDLCLRDLPADAASRFLVAMCAAYAERAGRRPDPSLLRAYAAAEFLNRCYRHLRRPIAGWQQAAAAELDRFPEVMTVVDRAAGY